MYYFGKMYLLHIHILHIQPLRINDVHESVYSTGTAADSEGLLTMKIGKQKHWGLHVGLLFRWQSLYPLFIHIFFTAASLMDWLDSCLKWRPLPQNHHKPPSTFSQLTILPPTALLMLKPNVQVKMQTWSGRLCHFLTAKSRQWQVTCGGHHRWAVNAKKHISKHV